MIRFKNEMIRFSKANMERSKNQISVLNVKLDRLETRKKEIEDKFLEVATNLVLQKRNSTSCQMQEDEVLKLENMIEKLQEEILDTMISLEREKEKLGKEEEFCKTLQNFC